MAAFVDVEDSVVEKLKFQLRYEQMKRREDYVQYQLELNSWKRLHNSLEESHCQMKAYAAALEEDCDLYEKERQMLRSNLRAKEEEYRHVERILVDLVPKLEEKVKEVAALHKAHKHHASQTIPKPATTVPKLAIEASYTSSHATDYDQDSDEEESTNRTMMMRGVHIFRVPGYNSEIYGS